MHLSNGNASLLNQLSSMSTSQCTWIGGSLCLAPCLAYRSRNKTALKRGLEGPGALAQTKINIQALKTFKNCSISSSQWLLKLTLSGVEDWVPTRIHHLRAVGTPIWRGAVPEHDLGAVVEVRRDREGLTRSGVLQRGRTHPKAAHAQGETPRCTLGAQGSTYGIRSFLRRLGSDQNDGC